MATLVRWSPLRSWSLIDREMQSMFDRLFEPSSGTWRPRVDIMREKDDLVVRAELPGIDPAHDLSLEVENNVLHIKGSRTETTTVDEGSLFVRERHFGSFERQITLPEGLDPDGIHAAYDAGVLTVRMPLPGALDTTARTIPVQIETTTESKAIETH